MTTELPLTTDQILKLIINSIPTNFSEKLSKKELNQLKQFSEFTDIPLESTEIYRELTALLILNAESACVLGFGGLRKQIWICSSNSFLPIVVIS
ncbi:MAG: hypothetical protein ACXAC8_04875 [Candidatus Hodarchaeales archaeon]|jgi:hypothetical protein